MNNLNKKLIFLLPLLWLMACGSDDENPTVADLITAQSWRVNNYEVEASTGGISIPESILEPFVDDILAQAPLNGIITFINDGSFTIEDQGTTINGTWSLSADEKELTMTFTAANQSFTFQIKEISANTFNLTFTTTENITIPGSVIPVPVTLEITAFLVPA